MTRKFKALGLALFAVFAMSAVVAQAAQAANPSIHYPNGQASGILTGAQEAGTVDKFTVPTILGNQAVECQETSFQATAAQGAEEVTIHPTYNNCKFNGEAATVVTNMCAYVFKKGETSAEGHAGVRIECEAGSHITVSTSLCTMSIGEQNTLTKGVHYTNVEGHITIKSTVENVATSGCSFVTGPGTYAGVATVRAYVDEGQEEGGTSTTPKYKEGAEIPVEVLNP